jgi:SP family arabinose:H+ symporter-like MFS transporter
VTAGRKEVNLSYVLFLGITAALGGLLFGFDIAIITGAGPFLESHFNLGHLGLGWAFSSLLFGCVIGSAFAGRLTDLYGRKRLLLWVAAMFVITSAATGLATSFTLFIIARLLGGLAVGGASILSPMYVSEVSPPAMRGRMGALYQMSIVVGILVSYCINYLLRDVGDWNWRWMFITGAIPSVIFFAMLWWAPETPRYLFKVGKKQEAMELLTRISNREEAQFEIAEMQQSLAESKSSLQELLHPGLRRALVVGFCLAILVHISGINTIIDYAPKIFISAGFKMDAALFSTFIVGLTNLVFTLVSFWTIDRYGRKPLYIVGSLGMAVALALLTVAVLIGHFEGMIVLGLILLFIAFFASCIGPVFWTLVPEIFPNRVRGTAMIVPVLTQWVVNAAVVLLFPWAIDMIGKAPVFGFLGAMSLLQAIFAWRFVPETKGKTLEEIESAWETPGCLATNGIQVSELKKA